MANTPIDFVALGAARRAVARQNEIRTRIRANLEAMTVSAEAARKAEEDREFRRAYMQRFRL